MEQKSLQLVPYAQRYAHSFGRIAEFWFNLQTLYEIRMAERKLGKVHQNTANPKTPTRFRINLPIAAEFPAPTMPD